MTEDFFVKNARVLPRYLKLKQFYCYEDDCILVCSDRQKRACFQHFWMLAEGDKPVKEIIGK